MKTRFSYSIPEMTARLLRIAKPARRDLSAAAAASVVGNLAHMGLMGFGALLLLRCAGWTDAGSPALFGALTALSAALIALGRYVEGVTSHAGAYRLLAAMRVRLFESIRRLAPACLMDRRKGDLINIAVSDIETVEFFFAHTIGPLFTVILLPLTTLALALCIHPLFAAVLLPVYLVIAVGFPLLALKIGRPVGLRYRESLGGMKSLVLESVYGIKDIQIFGDGPARLARVQAQNRRINRAAHLLTLHRQTVASAPTFFVYLARILLLAAATYLALHGAQDPVGTVVLSFVATASFSSTFSLTTVISSLLETYAAAERLFALEDTEPEVEEAPRPLPVGPIEEIDFDRVGFAYKEGGEEILRDFSLTVHKGDWVGIVGESGAGKSTILRLLLRFWNPTSGEIRLNGVPLQNVSLEELRLRVAMLEQDTFLIDASIAENIALGKPTATRQEIRWAAQRAGLADFIETLPDGYETQMGKMSARLSGGERQRVGIARVLLADPDVIVLDEPTASLDVLHEKELLKTLRELYRGKTLLLISHRLSTLTDCSRIVRLRQGRAEEDAV